MIMRRELVRNKPVRSVKAVSIHRTASSIAAPLAAALNMMFLAWALPVRGDTFAAGSYIIPTDTTYQDSGMLKAYGLVYQLTLKGVPVHWIINPNKAAGG